MGRIIDRTFYTYDDLTIMPCVVSSIKHRSECMPYADGTWLPLFTAPMDTVVDKDNFAKYESNSIIPIMPRTESLDLRKKVSISGKWAAYSLNEFSEVFCNEDDKLPTENKIKALIDVANGHMDAIFELARKAKSIYGDKLVLMGGNIANPRTYEEYAKCGFDFVRCSIGTGFGCLSSSNTSIHVPIASLISEIAFIKQDLAKYYDKLPYIIADGGIRGYRDIIKALALGADYVMCGSIFSKMVESAAPKIGNSEEWYKLPLDIDIKDLDGLRKEGNSWFGRYNGKEIFLGDLKLKFYGMASKEGQIALNGKKTKTSEGCLKTLPVEYTMSGWVENFKDYLRSAMSYVGTKTLDEFRDKAVLIVNSENAIKVVNK